LVGIATRNDISPSFSTVPFSKITVSSRLGDFVPVVCVGKQVDVVEEGAGVAVVGMRVLDGQDVSMRTKLAVSPGISQLRESGTVISCTW